MKYFKDLVTRLGLINNYLPLWKVIDRMSKQDLQELLDFIDEKLDRNIEVSYFAQEVCLMYAYWWHHKADGGKGVYNYSDAPVELGLRHKDEDILILTKALLHEMRNATSLKIPVYQSEGNSNRWLNSVLAQGGLPLKWLSAQGDHNYLLHYMKALLRHYESIVFPNWLDTTTAKQIAEHQNLPAIMRSQAMCGYCLSVVQSIISGEQIVSSSETVRQIVNSLVREHKNRDNVAFELKWSLEKSVDDKLAFCYSLRAPKQITIDEENSNVSSRRYYLNGVYVAEYLRQGDSLVLQKNCLLPEHQQLRTEGEVLFLERMDDNGDLVGEPMYNSTVPVIEEPVMLQYESQNFWKVDAGYKDDTAVIIYPRNFVPEKEVTPSVVLLNNTELHWCEITWNDYNHGVIGFSNGERRISIKRDNIEYRLYLNFPQYDWIESAETLLISRNTDLKHCIFVKDLAGNIINRWRLTYRSNNGYREYHSSFDLDCGLNTICVEFPDGRNRYYKFFLVESTSHVCGDNGILKFNCQGATLNLLAGQDVDCVNDGFKCPETLSAVKFQLSANGSDLCLSVSAPVPNSSFWDNTTGTRLPRNAKIAISQLHHYKVYQKGRQKLVISLYSNLNNDQLINASLSWQSNSYHTLSVIGAILERMMILYPLTRSNRIELRIGGTMIQIVPDPYSLMVNKTEDGRIRLMVENNGTPVAGIPLLALPVETLSSPDCEPIFIHDSKENCGEYDVPESLEGKKFIALSIDPARRFPAELVDPEEGEMTTEERILKRNRDKQASIAQESAILSNMTSEGWHHVWMQFDMVVSYQLPFATFNSLIAIKDNPELQAYFITHLGTYPNVAGRGELEIVMELERMEMELGFAFHYIPAICWSLAIGKIKADYEEIKDILQTMGQCEQDFINSYCKYYDLLLKRQFDQSATSIIYFQTIFNFEFPNPGFLQREAVYASQIEGTYIPNGDKLALPTLSLPPANDRLYPMVSLSKCRTIETKMRYFSILIPQLAAAQASDYNAQFWPYSEGNNCLKRLINYIRRYAPSVYNEIFIAFYHK